MRTKKNKGKYKKVILIGIDGATWTKILPLVKKNKLPNFKKLINNGAWGILKSSLPPSSPPAWNSLFSGVNPGKHKVLDFIKRKKNSYFIEPIFSSDRKSPLVWDYLTKKDKKTIAIGIPFAYPPSRLNGILTTGLGTPSKTSNFTYPKDFKNYILDKFPKFDVDFDENAFNLAKNRNMVLDKVKEVTKQQFLLAKSLFQKYNYDFFAIVFRSTDVIQHYFFNNNRIIEEYYLQIDKIIGWFLNHLDKDDCLIICSDHGFRSVNTRFYISNWLEKNGFLKIKQNKRRTNLIDADVAERYLKKLGLKGLVWRIKKSWLLEILTKYLIRSKRLSFLQQIDWRRTKLYHLGTSNGLLFINEKGREPLGILKHRDKYKLFEEFKKRIKKLKYKNKFVVNKVLFGEKVYSFKDNNGDLPDIVILLNNDFTLSGGISPNNEIFEEEGRIYGDHDIDGIICLYNKSRQKEYKRNKKVKSCKIYDIVPTILKMLDINVNIRFDGESLV